MAPLRPAWQSLGPIRGDLRRRHDLPDGINVLCGIHDSSANFYRYQQADLADIALFSTGTWIVGLAPIAQSTDFHVSDTSLCNADVDGRPLAGVLSMGGREFATLAGRAVDTTATAADVAAVIRGGTMALPSFSDHDVLFPGTAGMGRIDGPPPSSPEERRALALLYVALLTDACFSALGEGDTIVLDGSFVEDSLYPSLVAALHPDRRTLYNTAAGGTAAGAALLAGHEKRKKPATIDMRSPEPIELPDLAAYAARWCASVRTDTATNKDEQT
jgi:sugar (pentulose or hexulose) kinase